MIILHKSLNQPHRKEEKEPKQIAREKQSFREAANRESHELTTTNCHRGAAQACDHNYKISNRVKVVEANLAIILSERTKPNQISFPISRIISTPLKLNHTSEDEVPWAFLSL